MSFWIFKNIINVCFRDCCYFCSEQEYIMTSIIKIVKSVTAIVMLLAFFVSTTGFAFYEHVCNHHQKSKEVVLVKSNCCEEEPVAIKQTSHSCCEIQQSEASCQVETDHSFCCEFDINYFRLSEQFIDPQPLTRIVVSTEIELDCFGFDPEEAIEVQDFSNDEEFAAPIPKQPIYRLFQQAKTDPPLI